MLVLAGVLALVICALLVFRCRRRRLHHAMRRAHPLDVEKTNSETPSGSSLGLLSHAPNDHAASGDAHTAMATPRQSPPPGLSMHSTTVTAAAPVSNDPSALVASTRTQTMPRHLFWNLTPKGSDDRAAPSRPTVHDEESTPPPVPVAHVEQPSQTRANVRALVIPNPAWIERAARKRALVDLIAAPAGGSASEAQRTEVAVTPDTVASAPTPSTPPAVAADATTESNLRSQLSLIQRRVLEQQLQIDQMRAERLAEEQRLRVAETRSELGPPAYEGEDED
jgi:hypothetical protein